jgi:two-component system C4-dicarboxylate transport sensor histidine kinase DctB
MGLEKEIPGERLGPVSNRMGIITGQLKKIEDIVKGFLETTKKPMAREKSRVPISELVGNVVELVQPTLARHRVECDLQFKAEKTRVEVVPLEIEQVILNLVNNAVDSMKEKDPSGEASHLLRFKTWNESATGRIILEITDSGTGIPPQNLGQIFKPFFTTKTGGAGHGLGLSICQQIVRSYGGEILVESEWGKGAQVRVQLPVAG